MGTLLSTRMIEVDGFQVADLSRLKFVTFMGFLVCVALVIVCGDNYSWDLI